VYIVEVISNPKDTWHHIKKEAKHYWLGSKLLWSEIKVAYSIVGRLLQGFGMTRRER
jgi:LETM1 and EF-hand domain-containing protein 1, mitochondrial